ETTIDDLRDVWQQWRDRTGNGVKHGVEGVECLWVSFLTFPETITGTTHVPVGQRISELAYLLGRGGDISVRQCLIDILYQVMSLGEDVTIQHILRAGIELLVLGGVQGQEGLRMPDWQQCLAHTSTNALLGDNQVTAAQDW